MFIYESYELMFPCEYVFPVNKKYSKKRKRRNSWSFAFQRTSVTYAYPTKARFEFTDRRYARFIERYFVSNERERRSESSVRVARGREISRLSFITRSLFMSRSCIAIKTFRHLSNRS